MEPSTYHPMLNISVIPQVRQKSILLEPITNKYRLSFIYCLSFSSSFEIYQKHIHYKRKAVFITEELQEILGSFDSAQIIWYKASKEKSHDSTCTNLLSFDVVLHFIFDLHFTFGLLIEYLVLMDILCWDCLKVII